jgi:MerR family Zn(II)-responsive transcriptional regulator of zntA
MLINELSKTTGLTKDTIRYYTRLGLIPVDYRNAGSREYAEYDETAVKLVQQIKFAKSAGFTLSEIKQVIGEHINSGLTEERLLEILKAKLKQVKQKQKEIRTIEATLRVKINNLSKNIDNKD